MTRIRKQLGKCYEETFLNIKLEWDQSSLSEADVVIGVPHLIDRDKVKESITKIGGKATRPSGLV